jgi:hypothetical protein
MKYFYDTEFIEDGKTIDLISIGIVAEDGREFYAESLECDHGKASEWVKENVLRHLRWPPHQRLMKWRIRDLVREFCDPERYGQPEFWGYYADYDHVVLCQLFGTMMDLPKGWPMLTLDIRQWSDALGNPALPKQEGIAHDALADARWHKQMWDFLADYRHQNGGEIKK